MRTTFLFLMALALTGCQLAFDGVGDRHSQRVPAEERDVPSEDFTQGFKEGVAEVLQGGEGEPPAAPPRRYLGLGNNGGQRFRAVEDWYAGFQSGTAAAHRERATRRGLGRRAKALLPQPAPHPWQDFFEPGQGGERPAGIIESNPAGLGLPRFEPDTILTPEATPLPRSIPDRLPREDR